MMRSMPRRQVLLPLLLLLSGASACAGRVRIQPQFPPAADVEAAVERKPIAPVAIVTDAQAEARYNADVESWGDRVQAAAVRTCRWMNERGAKFNCGR